MSCHVPNFILIWIFFCELFIKEFFENPCLDPTFFKLRTLIDLLIGEKQKRFLFNKEYYVMNDNLIAEKLIEEN